MGIFSKLFGRAEPPEQSYTIIATLNCRLMPIDRGEYFEDPVDDYLKARNMGSVTGGGTMQNEDGTIAYCDVEMDLTDRSEKSLNALAVEFERLGAPKGSKMVSSDGTPLIEFGHNEILALSLDGVGLSAEVYETFDTDEFVEKIDNILGNLGASQGSRGLEERTEFYFSGKSYLEMENRIEATIGQFPICQGALVFQIS